MRFESRPGLSAARRQVGGDLTVQYMVSNSAIHVPTDLDKSGSRWNLEWRSRTLGTDRLSITGAGGTSRTSLLQRSHVLLSPLVLCNLDIESLSHPNRRVPFSFCVILKIAKPEIRYFLFAIPSPRLAATAPAMALSESCCTCATVFSDIPSAADDDDGPSVILETKNEKQVSAPDDRRLGCCSRVICGRCINVFCPAIPYHTPS